MFHLRGVHRMVLRGEHNKTHQEQEQHSNCAVAEGSNKKHPRQPDWCFVCVLGNQMARHPNTAALLGWVGRGACTVLFDSDRVECDQGVFFECVKGRSCFVVVGVTEENDVFGGFVGVEVGEQNEQVEDPSQFVFSFQARGRCKTPQRWFPKDKDTNAFGVWKDENTDFISFFSPYDVDNGFDIGWMSSGSFAHNLDAVFEGMDAKDLTGMDGGFDVGPFHHCKRVVAVCFD